ncbi:pyocin knob domain-containing protein [Paenibacillus sp. NRS-1760]|uniref:pyocin knob domain-containing protein n=1 Tax=Paenibacillus sp. NRS-1760 TaxID=3233902 RepID=UPI003D2D174F
MQTTGNLGLKKPEGTDVVDIADLNGNADILDTAVSNKVDKVAGKQLSTEDYTTAEKTKLAGVAAGANAYVHPANHPASVITQDASNRFVTDAEKSAWNAKASTAVATTSAAGLQSAADKVKLDGIAAGANNYTHPVNHPPSVITQDAANRFVTDAEKVAWNASQAATITQAKAAVNMNTLNGNGMYFVSTPTNAPAGVTYGLVHVIAESATACMQTLYESGSNRIFTRRQTNSSTWTAWSRITNDIIILAANTSLNTISASGDYYSYPSGSVNAPTASDLYMIIHIQSTDEGYAQQTAYSLGSNRVYVRNKINGTWFSWIQTSNDTILLTSGTNLNTAIFTGKYYGTNLVNSPGGGSGHWFIDVIIEHATSLTQTAYAQDGNRVFTRRCVTGSWTAWSQLSNDMYNYTTSGTEINFMQTDGWYHVPAGLNAPTLGQNYFIHVSKYPAGNWCVQNAYHVDTWKTYTRRMVNGVWTAWAELYTSEVKPYTSGAYTGNGADLRDIALPFTPSALLVLPATYTNGTTSFGLYTAGLAVSGSNVSVGFFNGLTIGVNKFTVASQSSFTDTTNKSNVIYNYIAFR